MTRTAKTAAEALVTSGTSLWSKPMTEQEIVARIEALKPVIMETCTEWVVVSDWAPLAGKPGTGGLSYEDFTDRRRAEEAFWDYERGEYPRARAVCIFASRNGIPIGRII
jgi:hypothetical protein